MGQLNFLNKTLLVHYKHLNIVLSTRHVMSELVQPVHSYITMDYCHTMLITTYQTLTDFYKTPNIKCSYALSIFKYVVIELHNIIFLLSTTNCRSIL